MASRSLRAERAAEAARLRADGLLIREVAERMDVSYSYVQELLADPTGAQGAARKASYRGVCEDCGGPTYGGNGRAKAPKVCLPCHNKRREPEHGTVSRYSAGCSCDDCRRAQRERMRTLQGKTPPTHGASAYRNYGCRCPVCKQAHSDNLWLRRVRRVTA